MGRVCDFFGRVKGHPGLYVVDAAFIPGSTGIGQSFANHFRFGRTQYGKYYREGYFGVEAEKEIPRRSSGGPRQ